MLLVGGSRFCLMESKFLLECRYGEKILRKK